MDISNYIKVYEKAIPIDLCQTIIEKFNKLVPTKFKNDLYYFDQINMREHLDFFNPEFNDVLQLFINKFKKYQEEVKAEYFPFEYGYEDLRIKKYPKDGYFKEHVDVSDYASARRFLSAFVYLNESGGTSFLSKMIKAKPGTIVIFPPLWMFPHTGLVGKTEKYFLSTYLHYL